MSLSEHIYFLDQILWEMLRLAKCFLWGDRGRVTELSQDPWCLNMGGWILNPRDAYVDTVSRIQDRQPGKLGHQPPPNMPEPVLESNSSCAPAALALRSGKAGAGRGASCWGAEGGVRCGSLPCWNSKALPGNGSHFLGCRTNWKEMIFGAIRSRAVFALYSCFPAWLPRPLYI